MAGTAEKPGQTTKGDDGFLYHRPRKGGPEFLIVTPANLQPRSPEGRRPREFFARSGVKRAKSKSKLGAAGSKRTGEHADGYVYNGQGLEVFVSTQTTAIASAPDSGRPRVFYPRSSSLQAARNHALPAVPPEPVPKSQSRRALPAVPPRLGPDTPPSNSHRRGSSRGSNSKSTRRIRPLPVPTRPPTSLP